MIFTNMARAAMVGALFFAGSAYPTFAGDQWEMAIGNSAGGGYFRAYTSVSECEANQDEGDTCAYAFNSCGSAGISVATTMYAINSIADPNLADKIIVYAMNGEDVGDHICAGLLR